MPFEVPEGWAWCRLEDIAYVAAGSTPSKESFVENGVPYIKMYNLRNQKIDFEFHPQYITEEVHNNKLARSRTQPGDLLMNIVGPPLGKLAIIPESLPEANFNQAAVLIRPFKFKPAITQYLFYYLSELSEINSISTKGSAGQVNISLTQSQQMRIALPPLAELERITQKIESLFSKIGVLETSIDNIYDHISKIKSGILEKALSGKLVSQDKTEEPAITLLKSINPDFEPTDNRHYENVRYPDSWEVVKMGEMVRIISGVAYSKSDVTVSGIKVIRGGNIQAGEIIECDDDVYIDNRYADPTNNIYKGDIVLVASTGSQQLIGKTGFATRDYVQTQIGAFLRILRPKDIRCADFLNLFFQSDYYRQYIRSLAKGTNINNVKNSYIEDFVIGLPPLQEQNRIVAITNKIFYMIDEILAGL